jgi:hypothetical protein
VKILRVIVHSPPTEHEINPVPHNLVLDKLMVANLDEVWYAIVVVARALGYIEIMEATLAVYSYDWVSMKPHSVESRNPQAHMR